MCWCVCVCVCVYPSDGCLDKDYALFYFLPGNHSECLGIERNTQIISSQLEQPFQTKQCVWHFQKCFIGMIKGLKELELGIMIISFE